MKKIIILLVILALGYTASDHAGLKTCFQSCVENFSTVCPTATDPDKDAQLDEIYHYEQCVRGISQTDFISQYCPGYSVTLNDLNVQNGKCAYFWSSDFDQSELNQTQLYTLFRDCFTYDPNNSYPGGGCAYDYTAAQSGNVDNSAGGQFFYQEIYQTCISTCAADAQSADEINFETCDSLCQATYTGASTNTAAYNTYLECVGSSPDCGWLAFLTFADFKYKGVWELCYKTPCMEDYMKDVTATDPKYKLFKCQQECPIPDASSFDRLDNTIDDQSSSILQISLLTLALLFISQVLI